MVGPLSSNERALGAESVPKVATSAVGLRPWLAQLGTADGWIALSALLVIGFGCSQIALFSFGRDQSIYVEVAERLLGGLLPYQATWDFKPPGIFGVYALALLLFGHNMMAPRLLEIGCLLGGCALLLSLSRTFFVTRRPGWIGAGIWAWTYAQFDFWHTAQPESFAAVLTLAGYWLMLRVTDARRPWLGSVLVGVLFGLTALLKPPLGGGAIVAVAYLVQQLPAGARLTRLLRMVAVGVGLALPSLLVALIYWQRGAWHDLQWTLFQFTPHYTQLGWRPSAISAFYETCMLGFVGFSALIAVGSLLAVAAPVWSMREHEGKSLLLGGISVHFVGIAMQAKFFPYHFGASLPLLALLAGLGWAKLSRWLERAGVYGAALILPLCALVADARQAVRDLPGNFSDRTASRIEHIRSGFSLASARELERKLDHVVDFNLGADHDVADRVRELTRPGDAIYIWGFEPAIYWLSGRAPASRYIYNVPQRCEWSQALTRQQLLGELAAQPPAAIIVQHDDRFKSVTGNEQDSAEALEHFPELASLLHSGYRFQEEIEDFDIYVRVPSS